MTYIIFLVRICHNFYMLCFLENMLPLIFFSLRVENIGECKFVVKRSEFVSVGGMSEQLLMRLTKSRETDLGKCTELFVALVSTFPWICSILSMYVRFVNVRQKIGLCKGYLYYDYYDYYYYKKDF